ncbi:hypothetical protein QSV08_11980 [Maribacter sp. BPC-D8]|uniref:hypothetical protein n=1 Tax=Maribacter sp. BPC-D8 TaxID=3053613 RepID=UPI002B4963C0|nr:hypothetical protein [Maribacter sp. BPC-D8]WRI27941.1 hypothetical protein QSV08_11980 [Maribacter sp. BPC-D8]
MLKIFKRNIKPEYEERLTKAFPKKLHSDLNEVLKIIPFDNNKVKLFGGTIHQVDNLIHESELDLILDNETLTIPYRLYFDEPNPELEKTLTDKQKDILNCIYLRHHNGYLRQKRLNLLSPNSEKWTIPFVVQLIGEYVYELLPIIEKKVNENTLDFYAKFRDENPKYWLQTESRMISYWNEYYRYKFPKLKEYLGFEIVSRIKKRTHNNI